MNDKVKIIIVILVIAVILGVCAASCSSGSSSSSSSGGKNGFVGSDGKYHNYIPEFGDDVNSWFEENW